jgi:saccharopine dehydrogenase (NAD+, L-lysine-forming)
MGLYLRDEIINLNERRCALTPTDVGILVRDLSFDIIVQRSKKRIFTDEEYEMEGAILTDDPWYHPIYNNFLIIGLKELDNLDKLDNHRHIYFSHSWKGQKGSEIITDAFKTSGSIIYDFELFKDNEGKRTLAFGYWAGVVGAALAFIEQGKCYTSCTQPACAHLSVQGFVSYNEMMNSCRRLSDNLLQKKIAIIGSEGRCGTGVRLVLSELGLQWTSVSSNDVIPDLTTFDIVFNCILLSETYDQVWFDDATVFDSSRKVTIVDISCDYLKPNNPIRLYEKDGIHEVAGGLARVIAIDNLPSLLPKESSIAFSAAFRKELVHLSKWNGALL